MLQVLGLDRRDDGRAHDFQAEGVGAHVPEAPRAFFQQRVRLAGGLVPEVGLQTEDRVPVGELAHGLAPLFGGELAPRGARCELPVDAVEEVEGCAGEGGLEEGNHDDLGGGCCFYECCEVRTLQLL